MTIEAWLQTATQELTKSGKKSARLDALLLLQYVLNAPKAQLLAHQDDILTSPHYKKLQILLNDLLNGKPLAYVINTKEFFGFDFYVNKDVLVPRPESESFIELLQMLNPKPQQSLLDIGTGSGCLAITAKKLFPSLDVTASDLSDRALKVAIKNAKTLQCDIDFIQSDLFSNLAKKYDYVFANLPYVPSNLNVSKEVKSEPSIAVFSGQDGLSCINDFLANVAKHTKPNSCIFMESLKIQHKTVSALAHQYGYKLHETSGLVQLYKE